MKSQPAETSTIPNIAKKPLPYHPWPTAPPPSSASSFPTPGTGCSKDHMLLPTFTPSTDFSPPTTYSWSEVKPPPVPALKPTQACKYSLSPEIFFPSDSTNRRLYTCFSIVSTSQYLKSSSSTKYWWLSHSCLETLEELLPHPTHIREGFFPQAIYIWYTDCSSFLHKETPKLAMILR